MRKQVPSAHGFEEGVSYRVVPCAAPPPESETDTSERAIEVMVLWGAQSVLAVEHLSEGKSFRVGDALNDKGVLQTDFLIGADVLGTDDLPIVNDGAVMVPNDSTCTLEGSDGCHEVAGPARIVLSRGQCARIAHRGFHFIVREIAGAKRVGVGRKPEVELARHQWTLASFAMHALLVGLMYFLPPSSSALSVDALREDDRYARYLNVPVVVEPEPEALKPLDEESNDSGKPAEGDSGKMGKKEAPTTKNRYAIKGPKDNTNVVMAREASKSNAATAGIIGVLKQQLGLFDAPTSQFGAEQALGRDNLSAIGALIGDLQGESSGFGGLGPIGTGVGGGGTARNTIGVGDLDTISGGERGKGYGNKIGGLKGREARVPRITVNPPEVAGSLSKEVIRRVIGRHINEIRYCYSQALNARPELQGRVAVRFVISPTGAVMTAAVVSSDLGYSPTEQCISKTVGRMTFPAPQGGLVVVTYPFVLQQTGN